jgi:hypothetical protein
MAGLGIALRGFGKVLKRSKLGKTLRRTFGDPKKTPQYKDEATGKMLKKLPKGTYRGARGIRFDVDEKGKIK